MTSRISRLVAAAALLCAAPAAAQGAGGAGAVEVGAFARRTHFDNSLGMKSTIGVGGWASVAIRPGLAFELDLSHTSADYKSGSGSATYTPMHARLVGTFTAGPRVEAALGGGYVHNSYGGSLDASDGGLSALLGLRYQATNRVWMRLGLDLDVMFHPSSDSPFVFYTGNWALTLGAAARLHGGGGGGAASSQSVGLLR
ncbi:MAG TPA: outer membrane beta-barrel protein [Gemmatimonadales bacterium]|jgi:hypothetical protein|nr:outer membrane beta-barrel protein [Gemmatimonadales bacterium]